MLMDVCKEPRLPAVGAPPQSLHCVCLQVFRECAADGFHRGRGVHHLGRRRLQPFPCRCLGSSSTALCACQARRYVVFSVHRSIW